MFGSWNLDEWHGSLTTYDPNLLCEWIGDFKRCDAYAYTNPRVHKCL